jgi:hypothetical protein
MSDCDEPGPGAQEAWLRRRHLMGSFRAEMASHQWRKTRFIDIQSCSTRGSRMPRDLPLGIHPGNDSEGNGSKHR